MEETRIQIQVLGIHIVVGRDLECPNQQVNESYMLIQKAVETAN